MYAEMDRPTRRRAGLHDAVRHLRLIHEVVRSLVLLLIYGIRGDEVLRVVLVHGLVVVHCDGVVS